MNNLKQKLLSLILSGCIALLVVVSALVGFVAKQASQHLGKITQLRTCSTATATTTLTFLTTTGATSTLICSSADAESIDLNFKGNSSSSPSTILWQIEFCDTYDSCYGEDGKTLTSDNIVTHHSASSTTHVWPIGRASTTLRNFSITPTLSSFVRFNFNTTGANSAVHLRVILKDNLGR